MFDALARLMNPGYTQLAPQDAARRTDLTIVDVRERDELKGELGHIPGAQHLPLQRLLAAGPLRDWTPETPLLLVCRSGARSASAASHLARQGFTQVYNLHGGMLAWNHAGLPVTRKRPR
jgi:rhodanese-related sulfurtransferase